MAILAPSQSTPLVLKGFGDDLVVAGYASVEMVDKQGDLITRGALKDAFSGFMKAEGFRNVQLAHSNIQVGTVIPSYTDSNGRVWKSEVDDTGMFVVIQLRGDIEKAREVASEIRKGNLRSFSIGGQAFERVNKSDATRGDYREIRRMELHEVTICEKGINPEAQFRILKEDTGDTMTDPMSELQSVLERLSKKLDDEEDDKKKKDEDADKGMPPQLDPDGDGDPGPFGDKPKKKTPPRDDEDDDEDPEMGMYEDDDEDDEDEDMMYGDDMTAKAEDMITMDYLNWLEQTAKGQGHDIADARAHFDSVNKGYGPGQSGYDHRGQGSLEGAGEGESSKRPKMDFGAAPKGNTNVIKANEYLNSGNVSQSDIEAAYEVYKAAATEQQFKGSLGNYFADRLAAEQRIAKNEKAKSEFDARRPLLELQKAVVALDHRISNVSSTGGETFAKSADSTSIRVPDTTEMANMSWDDVHRLADKALRGE
jgi:HK97 family phage prohead protease